jgi:eukaryotic-like serine/threonine-protein kinase
LKLGTIAQEYSTEVPKDHVISQDPTADILLERGDTVDLVVSLGVHMVAVPDQLVGLSEVDARTALRAAGLRVGEVISRNSDAPAGQVLSTDPPSGTQIAENSKVTLFVSNGQVKVPNVIDKDVTIAEGLLEQAGFTVLIRVAPVYDKKIDENIVVSQTPSPGTFAPTGPDNPVTIYYNEKPEPSPSPTATASPSASASPSPTSTASTSPTP